jgi:hypothetical protein
MLGMLVCSMTHNQTWLSWACGLGWRGRVEHWGMVVGAAGAVALLMYLLNWI